MGRYGRINSSLWTNSEKWRQTRGNDQARLLYFYLHTNQHANSVLTYYLPMAYMADAMGWDLNTTKEALGRLSTTSLVVFCEPENVVHVVGAVIQDPPTNKDHAKSMVKALSEIEDCEAKALCAVELQACEHAQALLVPARAIHGGWSRALMGKCGRLAATRIMAFG